MEYSLFKDIPSFNELFAVKKINKGWSKDQKFYIENKNKDKFLLRISDISTYDNKKKEFKMMEMVSKFGINMSRPLDFGTCGDGKNVYSLFSFIDGVSADEKIKQFTDAEQFNLGIKAGRILKKFHSITLHRIRKNGNPEL